MPGFGDLEVEVEVAAELEVVVSSTPATSSRLILQRGDGDDSQRRRLGVRGGSPRHGGFPGRAGGNR
jgi:hypothetical protein